MKNLLAVAAAMLIVAAFSIAPASARHRHHAYHARSGMMMGGNAELGGNNANSASGSNSVGHIKGGNNGAGK